MEFEHIIRNNDSFWFADFSISSLTFPNEKKSNNSIQTRSKRKRERIYRWYTPLLILILLCLGNADPTICSKELLIRIISYEYWLEMVYPVIEIYVIFDSYFLQIHSVCRDEKWETKVLSNILAMSPDSEYRKRQGYEKSHEPDMMRFCNNEKIDIRIRMCREHGERICDRNHLHARNPREFLYIFLCSLKKENLMLIRFRFHVHEGIKFLFVPLHTIWFFWLLRALSLRAKDWNRGFPRFLRPYFYHSPSARANWWEWCYYFQFSSFLYPHFSRNW